MAQDEKALKLYNVKCDVPVLAIHANAARNAVMAHLELIAEEGTPWIGEVREE